ncbi:DUF484 family protein [Thioflexithrix psekupsensis]|uniref:Phytochrome sensor protein n=1 Tax=Thioflexithrix psekupsensis TaxID=1570016 RepID=A0A251X4Z3_9GAMM|nr:DUF484 family protein [Thioflexithrix psekupsensis]OUD12564.1 hypothetical protein TPSD3_15890 [Thioflexithrix psekupsensis]
MSNQHLLQIDELSEKSVVDYLRVHPEFFMNHSELLTKMVIPHQRGSAVSLVEKQLMVLREENQQLQRRLENLIVVAKQNEQLNKRIQRLLVFLTGVNSIDEFFDTLYDSLRNEFNTDAVVVRMFEMANPILAGRAEYVEYDAQVFTLFENLLSTNRPECGRLSAGQMEYLFPNQGITSAVMIPLGIPKPQGVLAMGSREVSRFHAGMATDLLKYMGELVSQLLRSWSK